MAATDQGDSSRRADERVPALLLVNYKIPGVDAFVERYSANVARGGVFIVTHEVHPVGSELSFELRTTDGQTALRGKGVVKWLRAYDAAKKQLPGLGVQFTDVDAANRATLERMLQRQASTGVAPPSFSTELPAVEAPPPRASAPPAFSPPASSKMASEVSPPSRPAPPPPPLPSSVAPQDVAAPVASAHSRPKGALIGGAALLIGLVGGWFGRMAVEPTPGPSPAGVRISPRSPPPSPTAAAPVPPSGTEKVVAEKLGPTGTVAAAGNEKPVAAPATTSPGNPKPSTVAETPAGAMAETGPGDTEKAAPEKVASASPRPRSNRPSSTKTPEPTPAPSLAPSADEQGTGTVAPVHLPMPPPPEILTLDERIKKVIQSHQPQLQNCYDRFLKEKPDLKGKILLEFSTDARGKVKKTTVVETNISDWRVPHCVRQVFKDATFPGVREELSVEAPIFLTPDRMNGL